MNKLLIISMLFNLVFVVFLMLLVNSLGGVSYLLFKMRGGTGITGLYEHRKNLFEMLPTEKGEIIFLGDSITAECEWSELFDNEEIRNRGIGGDTATGILKRLPPIVEAAPRKLFLMVGINDLIYGNQQELIQNYEKILEKLTTKLTDTEIVVQSILPVNSQVRQIRIENETILEVNRAIKALAYKFGLVYADLNTLMIDNKKQLKAEFTKDGIHINGAAYLIWKEAIAELVNG